MQTNEETRLSDLLVKLRAFRDERDWQQFHTPKNLTTALMVETAELAEHFQWLTAEESENLSDSKLARVKLEMADVFAYLLLLGDRLNIDLIEASLEKIVLNEHKYPVDKARGKADKYYDLE